MIGYPNGKKISKPTTKQVNKSNLGRSLEDDVNQTNQYYQIHKIALVHKKPTPITVVEVDYPRRSAAMITKAFYQLPSTTDYNGIYRGIPIDFEAKQTQNKTRLPLSMIHKHQLTHLKDVLYHGGYSFLIVRFSVFQETFLIPFKVFNAYISNGIVKSVPYTWFKEHGLLIPYSYLKPCDYIEPLSQLLLKEKLL